MRDRIVWHPKWCKEYHDWSYSFLYANKWRCDPLLTIDDLMQEAYLTFRYIAERYPRIVCPKQFMGYFKRAMINKMHDRSCFYSRRKNTVEAPIYVDDEIYLGRIGEITNNGYMLALLNQMPDELKAALALIASGKFDTEDKKRKRWEPRENMAQKLFKQFGFDPIVELRKLLA